MALFFKYSLANNLCDMCGMLGGGTPSRKRLKNTVLLLEKCLELGYECRIGFETRSVLYYA